MRDTLTLFESGGVDSAQKMTIFPRIFTPSYDPAMLLERSKALLFSKGYWPDLTFLFWDGALLSILFLQKKTLLR